MIYNHDAEISNIIENYKNQDNKPTFEIVRKVYLTKTRAYKALEKIENVESFKVFWDTGGIPWGNKCRIVYKKKELYH